jgi:large subunit ribosomal protein L3
MSKGLIGEKVGMTQIFSEDGNRIPVTVIRVGGNVVVQKKSAHGKDGYSAIKLGFGDVKKLEKEGKEPKWRLSQPRAGVFLKAGIEAPRRHTREFRIDEKDLDKYEVGQELGAEQFTAGEWIDVAGTSKGRGFAGVMKRHNFAGAKGSHGVHEFFRHGGSIGASATPGRVLPGKRMAGQMGNANVTIQNLRILRVLPEDNAILVKGAIPGPTGGIVTIKPAVKKARR